MTAPSHLKQVTDSSFESEVLRCKRPTIVGFWAQWSGAAKLISSAVRESADRYAGEVKCVWLDVDEDPRTPSTYAVKTLPTLLVFDSGEVVRRVDGAIPRAEVHELFESALE